MKKLLTLLLALAMLLSVAAIAESIDDIDAPYDPPINITAWRFLSSAIQFENGDTIEKNIYIDRYLSDLGINLTYDWVVAEEQFDQKMSVSIASGDLPDLMWLKSQQLKELAQEGKLYDLTELFDTYANQYAKDTLCADMLQFATAMIDGKLYAIPHTASSFDSLGVLFIRTDWLEKLGLEEPTNLDELEAIIEAFVILGSIAVERGVRYSFPLMPMKFAAEHSSIYLCVFASVNRQSYPIAWAASVPRNDAA